MNIITDFITNKFIYVPLLTWFSIQLFKVIWDLVTTKKFNFKRILGAGGMPSSHSAVVVSLATLVGRECGFNSPTFALAIIFAFVVMYDAVFINFSFETAAVIPVLINSVFKILWIIGLCQFFTHHNISVHIL